MATSIRRRRSSPRLKAKGFLRPKVEHFLTGEVEEPWRHFYDNVPVMMGTVELSGDDIIHISDNGAVAAFLGTTPEALRGRTARSLGVPEKVLLLWLEAYRASVSSDGPVRFEYEHEGTGWLKVTVTYLGLREGHQRFLYVVDDITDHKRTEQALQEAHDLLEARVRERTAELEAANYRLQHQAYYDDLTGLPNRRLFTKRLAHALERCQQDADAGFTTLFMDLDHFKVINDSLGHPTGDALLIAFSQRLLACLREVDTLARFGGDKFTILLENCDAACAAEATERLRKALSRPFELGRRSFTISGSVGVVFSEECHKRPQDLLRDADLAMSRAKAHRSWHFEIFDSSMREEAVRRLELEANLRVALEQQALSVYFQPIVRLDDRRLSGFEALVRWHHPRHGLLTPDTFIPMAEETGLIIELDRQVLRAACSQLARWRAEFPEFTELSVNVNLSSQQFMYEGLTHEVEQALLQHGLSPYNLNLEITEGLLMHPGMSVDAAVEQLAALGVGLCLDDFGTGYASLSYVQRFPMTHLKIDRSFVRSMDANEKEANLVEAVVTMAQKLGMQVVAEGVETNEQLERLRELGCGYGQGYLFGRPLTAEQAVALLGKTLSVEDVGGL